MDKQTSEDRKLIDRITYLASLASEGHLVDDMLDALRKITARWDNTAPLDGADRKNLATLETKLKDFLVNKDPLRSFTGEELEDRIRLREIKKPFINKYLIATIVSFVLGGFAYLIPIQDLTSEYRILIAAATQLLVSQLATVWFYISNLGNFKKEFRQAYALIAFGILPIGILYAQIGLVQILGIGETPPFHYGGMTYFAALAFVFMYFGLRKYALLLKIKTSLPLE